METYAKTDQYLHWLCQLIAKVNKSYVPVKSDDSHTNLYYDQLGDRIDGRWIKTEKGHFIFSLNLLKFRFEWLDANYNPVAIFNTEGKTMMEIEQSIKNFMPELGLDKTEFMDQLHYQIPTYSFAKKPVTVVDGQFLDKWKYYRKLANEASGTLLGYLKMEGEIRIWPHHFDTGIYVTLKSGLGIGFGLAMSDTMVGDSYYYISGYLETGTSKYKNLPDLSLGSWITNTEWKGAVLPISKLNKLPSENHHQAISNFLLKTVNWFVLNS